MLLFVLAPPCFKRMSIALANVLFVQHWSKVEHPVGEPRPARRVGHAAVSLGYGGDHPQLLVIGGHSSHKLLNDVWLLEVKPGHWREVSVEVVMC